MSYKAKWYTEEGNLRSLGREHLNQLLDRYTTELAAGGISIAEPEDDDAYYRALVEVFMRPEGIPLPLHEALYFIKGLDNPNGEERLVKAVLDGRLRASFNGECSTADKALQAWLADDALVKQLHIEVGLDASRSFLHLRSDPRHTMRMASFATVQRRMEAALATVFGEHAREEWAEVSYHPRGHEHVFVIRRTEPFRRETRRVHAGTEPLYYWPTEQDLVVYNDEFKDLRMNVNAKWQKVAYAQVFGQYLFAKPDVFSEGPKYSLQPLRDRGQNSLEASAFGIRSIRLHELTTKVRDNANDYRIRRSEDVFESYAQEGGLPEGEALAAAKFKVRFNDSSSERIVTIQPPNRAKFMQDENGLRVTAWMQAQEFIISQGPAPAVVLSPPIETDPPHLQHVVIHTDP